MFDENWKKSNPPKDRHILGQYLKSKSCCGKNCIDENCCNEEQWGDPIIVYYDSEIFSWIPKKNCIEELLSSYYSLGKKPDRWVDI